MTTHQTNEQLDEQPLVTHLIELRSRLLKCLAAVLVVFLALFNWANTIYEFVAEPLQKYLPANSHMIATDVASPFLTPFKLTLFTSVFIAMPFIFYQIWAFIAPALYNRERKIALPLFGSSVVLFYAGMAFAYYVVFPLVFGFFTSVGPESVAVMTDITKYQSFVIKLFFAFGAAFEIPVATVLLISAGVLSSQQLARKRPYVVVACFVIGMLLTPPDIISQAMLAIPMWILFELGLLFGRFVRPHNIQDTADSDS
ncbi:twin-arginine translocase subunit TatC [Teredinibacter turnerae]|uniref:twin-arginine translocase subunit TatC n=1 Tax=Teredinibacter turnerae TaxID=2426 RepID=UPI00036F6667|nr:twin-arginine translocase subunit TatC [Teredinibacter turnerae]